MTAINQPIALPENTHILYLIDDRTEEYEAFTEEAFKHHIAHAFYFSADASNWDYADFTYVTHSQGLDPYGAQLAIKIDGGWHYDGRVYDDAGKLKQDMWKEAARCVAG